VFLMTPSSVNFR